MPSCTARVDQLLGVRGAVEQGKGGVAVQFSVHSPDAQTHCRPPPAVRPAVCRLPSAVCRATVSRRDAIAAHRHRRAGHGRRAGHPAKPIPALRSVARRVLRARRAPRRAHGRHRHARPVPLRRLTPSIRPRASSGCARRGRSRKRTSGSTAPRASASSRSGRARTNYEAGIRFYADWNGFIAGYTDWFTRIESAGDFARLKKSNKVGIMLTFQNADHFRTPDDVNTFHTLGQRLSQLTYNATNRLGSGFLADTDAGLTPFGAEIVARMNARGDGRRSLALRRPAPRSTASPRRRSPRCSRTRRAARSCREPALQDRRDDHRHGEDRRRDGDPDDPLHDQDRRAGHDRARARPLRPRREARRRGTRGRRRRSRSRRQPEPRERARRQRPAHRPAQLRPLPRSTRTPTAASRSAGSITPSGSTISPRG